MIQANELRIGNILNYTRAEGDILPAKIDLQDLKWISEDHKGFNIAHDVVQLTEEILSKCPEITKCTWRKTRYNIRHKDGQFHLDILNDRFVFRGLGMTIVYVDTLHHLQNLVFVTSGKELEVSL